MAELVKRLAVQTAEPEDQGSNPTRSGIENGEGAERAEVVDGGGYFLKGGGFYGGEEGRGVIWFHFLN